MNKPIFAPCFPANFTSGPKGAPTLASPVDAGAARRRFRLPAHVLALATGAALLASQSAQAADTPDNVVNGQTDLTLAGSYSAGLPGTTSDVTFTNAAYSPAAFTLNSSLAIGTLDDLSATALTIQNTSATADTLTLSTAANATSGAAAADLLYVATGGSLSLGGGAGNAALNLTLAVAGNFDIAGTGVANISSAISATGLTLTKTGAGTLNLLGAGISATGQINQQSGTISFGSATDAPALTATNSSVSVFVVGGNFNMVNGTLNAMGGNQGLVLNGNNTYTQTGGTFSTNGRIELANGGGTSALNVSAGTLSTTLASGIETVRGTSAITLSGTGGITVPTVDLSTTQINSATGTASSTFSLNGGTLTTGQIIPGTNFAGGAGGAFNFNGGQLTSSASSAAFMQGITAANVLAGGVVFNAGAFTDTINQNLLASTTSTGGGLTVQGTTGSLILGGTNTFTGGTTISSGTLSIGGAGSLGSGIYAGNLANAGTFNYNSTAAQTLSGVISGAGTLSQTGAGTLTLSGANTYTGNTATGAGGTLSIGGAGSLGSGTYAGNLANAGTFNYNSTAAQTLSGVISGVGTLSQTGAGTLTLSGANTYTGPTNVNGGTLAAGVATVGTASGPFGVNSAVTLANVAGTTLNITGFNTSIGSLTGGGATGGTVTLGTAILTVGGNNTSPASYAGTFSGTGSLTKTGTGTLTLGGNGTSSIGGIQVSGGAVAFGSATEAPTYSVTTSATGVYIGNTTSTGNFTLANGSITANVVQGLILGGTNTYTQTGGTFNTSGIIEFANNGTGAVSTVNISGGSLTTTNNINGGVDALDMAVRGSTTLTLSGTGMLTTKTVNMTTNQTSATGTNSTFNLGNGTVGGGTLTTGQIIPGTNTSTGARTFNFNGGTLQASASSTTFLQGITAANVQAGGAIINTQANSITIGQPLLNGTAAGTPDGGLTVNGASKTAILTLAAANTFTGPTTLSTGALTLTTSSALSDTALLNIANGTAFSLNAANGTSEIVGSLVLGGTAVAPNTYTAAQLTALDGSITFSSSLGETLTVAAAVPEPSTWAMGLTCLGMLGLRLRRRLFARL